MPNAWDDIKFIDGYPGKDVIIARKKGNEWFIGGINADNMHEKTKKLSFAFLPDSVKYKLTLIADGKHDKDFSTRYLVVDKTSTLNVKMLRRGGFVISLKPY